MPNRLLGLVAILTSAVVGCDDPEVQDKVSDVLQYGSVTAELSCGNFSISVCGSTVEPYPTIYKLIDGSSTFQIASSGYIGLNAFQFNPKGYLIKLSVKSNSGLVHEYVLDTHNANLTYYAECSSSAPASTLNTINLNDVSSCSGRNLEAFGIDP